MRLSLYGCQVINQPRTVDHLILWPDLYADAKKTGPTGQTGEFFAKIAPSSQKPAPLICLWSRGSGASHNHPFSRQERSLPPWKQRETSDGREARGSTVWNPRPPTCSGKVANSFARSFASSSASVFLPPLRAVHRRHSRFYSAADFIRATFLFHLLW